MVERRAHRPVVERLVDQRRVEREVLAHLAVVDGDARVLADEVVLTLGDLDVLEDRLEDALPRDRRLPPRGFRQRIAQVLRDVLQRPDVQVRCGVLNGLLNIELDGTHAAALSAAALPARRPNTVHSRSELPIIRFLPCVPPAISPAA